MELCKPNSRPGRTQAIFPQKFYSLSADPVRPHIDAALGPAVFAEAFAAGQRMTLAEANRLVVAVANPPTVVRS